MGLTYDWRLAVPNLEIRDKYHSRLKNSIEEFVRIHNEKVHNQNGRSLAPVPTVTLGRRPYI